MVCRSANQNQVILPSIEGKLRKNALCLNQSAFSNFALYVISYVIVSILFYYVVDLSITIAITVPFVVKQKEASFMQHARQNITDADSGVLLSW